MSRDLIGLHFIKSLMLFFAISILIANFLLYNTNHIHVYGHANPISYLPSANSVISNGHDETLPGKAVILFSERPEPKVSYIHVTNSKNERVDNNDFEISGQNDREASVTLDKNKLSDGIFSVSWLILSRDDGHITKGTYVFSIQSPEQQQLQQESDNNSTFSEHAIVDNVNMTLMISPFSVGQNTFNVTLSDPSGNFASNIKNVIISITNQDVGLGPIVANLNKTAEGKFAVDGGYLSQPGEWEIKVTAQRSGAYDLNHSFEARVNASSTNN
jgi:methionine-rich copper-binding protein CopC